MADYDAVIIGAGISGLSVGALLANAGKRVLVLEQSSDIGGRAFSTNYGKEIVDNGVHGLVPQGRRNEVFSRLGKTFPSYVPYKGTEVFYEGKWQNLLDIFRRSELRKIMEKDILPLSYEEMEKYDDIPLIDWLSKRTDNKGLHLFFWFLA